MLKTFSTEPPLDSAPPSQERPAKPSSARSAMRYPGDQPKAPPSPPPRKPCAERSLGQQGSSGQQE